MLAATTKVERYRRISQWGGSMIPVSCLSCRRCRNPVQLFFIKRISLRNYRPNRQVEPQQNVLTSTCNFLSLSHTDGWESETGLMGQQWEYNPLFSSFTMNGLNNDHFWALRGTAADRGGAEGGWGGLHLMSRGHFEVALHQGWVVSTQVHPCQSCQC